MSFDTQVEVLTAEMELRVAYQLFYGTPASDSSRRIDYAGKVLRAETRMKQALRSHSADGRRLVHETLTQLAELAEGVARGATLCAVKQSRANFLAREASDSGDGWTWPVQVMQAGWAHGTIEAPEGKAMPHYYPVEIAAQVAEAANGARFRRKHPPIGDGNDSPELTAGFISDTRMQDSAVLATVNLLKSEEGIRSTLLAAQEANKLDLFSVSIMAYFGFKKSQAEGRPALVATSLGRFVGLDMCAEPGAGGRFLTEN